MRKAIVTGATGFIGRFMVRELMKQKVEVYAVVREGSQNLANIQGMPVHVISCDLAHMADLPERIPERDIDAIFHMAWQGISNEEAKNAKIQLENVWASLTLIDAAHTMGVRTFVGAGSLHEAESLVELNAEKPISNPGYMYKSAKLAAHMMGKAKAGSYRMRFFWPLINTYGEEEHSPRLINTVIRKIYKGEVPALTAGEQIYDFVHVSDVAYAMYLIAEKGVDGANYVIGSGDAKPLKEFLKVVGQIANRLRGNTEIPLGFGQITSNVVCLPRNIFDIENLKKDTGFIPQVSFEDGVQRTAEWIMASDDNRGERGG